MERNVEPPSDPTIQAFGILDDRITNVEDDITTIKDALKWMEMRNTGPLNNKLLGYPFQIISNNTDGEPLLEAAVLEVILSCDESNCHSTDTVCGEQTNSESFAQRFLLEQGESVITFGLVAESSVSPALNKFIDETVSMVAEQRHRAACVRCIHIHSCGSCELSLFAAGVRVEASSEGADNSDDEVRIWALRRCFRRGLREHSWFRWQLQCMPRFRALLDRRD
jgi:hypothetical protein